MALVIIRKTLAWCAVMNIGFLLWWFLFFVLAHDWTYGFHRKWFKLSVEEFDTIHYKCMALFKISIFVFNLVPYFALRIVG